MNVWVVGGGGWYKCFETKKDKETKGQRERWRESEVEREGERSVARHMISQTVRLCGCGESVPPYC